MTKQEFQEVLPFVAVVCLATLGAIVGGVVGYFLPNLWEFILYWLVGCLAVEKLTIAQVEKTIILTIVLILTVVLYGNIQSFWVFCLSGWLAGWYWGVYLADILDPPNIIRAQEEA